LLGISSIDLTSDCGGIYRTRLSHRTVTHPIAVPGSPLDERCRGCNDLIRQGAHLTESLDDVLAHLPQAPDSVPAFTFRQGGRSMSGPANRGQEAPAPTGDEAQVLELLGPSPISIDDLLRRCQLSTPAVQAILLDLELSGRAEMLPGNRVALTGKG